MAQITGTVTNNRGEPLPWVNIHLQDQLIGTTSNDDGQYVLEVDREGSYSVVFKYLGFETKVVNIKADRFPYELNVSLSNASIQLAAVELNADDNPALDIIRKAIANRKSRKQLTDNYRAAYYSKGLIKIQNAPQKLLGQDLGDFGGGLDSTRSGIIYLSETISEISKKGKEFNENITASKVSGESQGFSFNNASDVEISYYDNTIEFGNQLISPIANNALSYYRYRLEGTFVENGKLVNQLKVIPKRANDPVFQGRIYIVEDDWELYATELSVTGEQSQVLAVDSILVKQSFNYSSQHKGWLKMHQSLDFSYDILSIKGKGRFTSSYSNYELDPSFVKGDFTNAVVTFDKDANEKDSIFWKQVRTVPLTIEEVDDYQVKDSIQELRESKPYLDSLDRVSNKFDPSVLLGGYTYKNSFKEQTFRLKSPLAGMAFNTVQGFRLELDLSYTKNWKEEGRRLRLGTQLNYGFADGRFRPRANLFYRFNRFSYPQLTLSGGRKLSQFNNNDPITPIINSISSLFFEDNYAKFYEVDFIRAGFGVEVFNGLRSWWSIGYEWRRPVFNETDYVIIDGDDDRYTSNNPLDPNDFDVAVIGDHRLYKFTWDIRWRPNQKYLAYPDAKYNYIEGNWPTIFVGYEKGFGAIEDRFGYDQLKIRARQGFVLGNKGLFDYNLKAGVFINADDISFVDYQHFNGNRTHVGTGDYLNGFHLLPYYELSTEDSYFEGHVEYNSKSWLIGKIPLLNKLNADLIFGGHVLATENRQPYTEWTVGLGNLGWKNFRFFRIDWASSSFSGRTENGITFGFELLGLLNN